MDRVEEALSQDSLIFFFSSLNRLAAICIFLLRSNLAAVNEKGQLNQSILI